MAQTHSLNGTNILSSFILDTNLPPGFLKYIKTSLINLTPLIIPLTPHHRHKPPLRSFKMDKNSLIKLTPLGFKKKKTSLCARDANSLYNKTKILHITEAYNKTNKVANREKH
jgi:hypothetical protein